MRYLKEVTKFCEFLRTGERPTTFEAAYEKCADRVCGFYESEARATWEVLRTEKIEWAAEIGRNRGGGLYFLVCACPELKYVRSVDIAPIEVIDKALGYWLHANRIGYHFQTCDSREAKADMVYDLVYIDGEHTGPGVRADIENWRRHARIIGFHDYADRGGKNKHKRAFPDVVAEIRTAAERYGWEPIGQRGRSEIFFRISDEQRITATG